MSSRVGVSKVIVASSSFAMGVIPSIAPYTLTSSTVAASDWTSSRLYCEYTASNGSNQVSMATYVSPQVGSPFYLNQPVSLSLVGVNQNMIVDMDLSTAAEVKVWFTEVGNTAAPGTINASLLLTHDRAAFLNQQLPALTPITTQGDLIVGDATGNAIRLGLGSAGQVLTVSSSTATWKTPTGGGGSLPTATAAGQTLLSTGAGTTYNAVDFGSQVSSSVGATPSFDTGNGWSIVDTAGTVGSFPGGGIARFTCTATPLQHDFLSARIERPFAYDGSTRYLLKVRPRAASITGDLYPSMFLRDATNIFQFIWAYPLNQVLAGNWTSPGLQPPGFVNQTFALDGTDSFIIRIEGLNVIFSCVGTSNLPLAVFIHTLTFVPTHVGINANSDIGTGVFDFSDFTITTY